MLSIFPKELTGKIHYVDGKITATEELTDEEQIIFDDFAKKEQEEDENRFVEIKE